MMGFLVYTDGKKCHFNPFQIKSTTQQHKVCLTAPSVCVSVGAKEHSDLSEGEYSESAYSSKFAW